MQELSLKLDEMMKEESTKNTANPMDEETEEKLRSLGYIQ